jgi:hypothetical protein
MCNVYAGENQIILTKNYSISTMLTRIERARQFRVVFKNYGRDST